MTDPTGITSLYSLIGFGLMLLYQWYSARENRQITGRVAADVNAVGHAVNGQTAALVQTASELAYAKGLADGVKAERAVAAALLAPPPAQPPAVRPEGEGVRP